MVGFLKIAERAWFNVREEWNSMKGLCAVFKSMGPILLFAIHVLRHLIIRAPQKGDPQFRNLCRHFIIKVLKGVAIIYCCRARQIPDKQICFVTSSEHEKVLTRSIGNNKGVAMIMLSARKYPEFNRFPST